MVRLAILTALAALLLTASAALAAPSGPKPGWEARSGVYKTMALAHAHVLALAAKGFTGFVVEVEGRPAHKPGKQYEVEKEYSTEKAAQAEVSKLHKSHFVGALEWSAGAR